MEQYQNATIDPICAACGDSIGGMPMDTYVKAIEYRGPRLLCPDCRTHKCDCCGWFIPGQTMRSVVDADGKYLGNACDACFSWVISDDPTRSDFPHFRIVHRLNLGFVRFTEENGERIPSLVVEELL